MKRPGTIAIYRQLPSDHAPPGGRLVENRISPVVFREGMRRRGTPRPFGLMLLIFRNGRG